MPMRHATAVVHSRDENGTCECGGLPRSFRLNGQVLLAKKAMRLGSSMDSRRALKDNKFYGTKVFRVRVTARARGMVRVLRRVKSVGS